MSEIEHDETAPGPESAGAPGPSPAPAADVPPPVFAIVGHVNKGKSSMVSTLAEDDSVRIEREAGTTIACREFPMRVDARTLFVLVDTPGFEQARHALAWLREHETSAAERPRVVADFVRVHARSGEFPEECRLLEPVLKGAGILYVVDGSRPYSPEYEAEMEILRWTGRPRMALVNRIGKRDHTAEWYAALDQYFSVVKGFDAHRAGFHARIGLLKAFRELREDWRPPLDAAIAALEAEHEGRRSRSAHAIADMVADALTLTVSERLPLDGDPAPLKEGLEQRFRDELRARERRGRDQVERIYQHTRLDRREGGLELVDDDLFAESIWLRLGLSRTQLIATGALGGAIAGGAIDAAVGGASMFAGSIIGAAAGAGAGWWSHGQLARTKVLGQPMGGKLAQMGPVRDPQFAWVLLDRALIHQRLVSERSHAVREAFVVGGGDGEREGIVATLDASTRRSLTGCFSRIRRGLGGAESGRAVLARAIEELIADREPRG